MSDIIVEPTVQTVPIDSLTPHPQNPRVGDIDRIAESLRVNHQYRPLVVNKNTGTIVAGNHTWQAAKRLGWGEIAVNYIDVDDETALRIMLVDNRTSDFGSYNPELLTKVLDSLPNVEGTGYNDDEVARLLNAVKVEAPQEIEQVLNPPTYVATRTYKDDFFDKIEQQTAGGYTGGVAKADIRADEDIMEMEDVSSDLQGILTLREDVMFDTDSNPWGIPDLLDDRLVKDIPDGLDTWAGLRAHSDEEANDPSITWLYNYGRVETKGLDYSRAVLCFYTYDDKFENWWGLPGYYTAKLINAGVKMAVVPDFSLWSDDPRALQLFNVYRAQWLGRYFQEAGLDVIARLQWSDHESFNYCFMGIPVGVPVAAMSIQNVNRRDPVEVKSSIDGVHAALDIVQPQQLIVYAGVFGHRLVRDALSKRSGKSVPKKVRYLDNYAKKCRDAGVIGRQEHFKGTQAQVDRAQRRDEEGS